MFDWATPRSETSSLPRVKEQDSWKSLQNPTYNNACTVNILHCVRMKQWQVCTFENKDHKIAWFMTDNRPLREFYKFNFFPHFTAVKGTNIEACKFKIQIWFRLHSATYHILKFKLSFCRNNSLFIPHPAFDKQLAKFREIDVCLKHGREQLFGTLAK